MSSIQKKPSSSQSQSKTSGTQAQKEYIRTIGKAVEKGLRQDLDYFASATDGGSNNTGGGTTSGGWTDN